jgi:hypothetical protein
MREAIGRTGNVRGTGSPHVGRDFPAESLAMDVWDHEGNAMAVFREAGIDPAEPQGPHALARALLGRGGLRYGWTPLVGAGCYEPSRGGRPEAIWLRPKLTPFREAWTIYHELAERHLYGSVGEERHELACDQLAACLRAPRAAFRQLVADVGLDLEELAEGILCSQTSAALRWGETTHNPIAVLSPTGVRVRGDDFAWPHEEEVRKLARAKVLPSSVRRVPITDGRGRVAIVAA